MEENIKIILTDENFIEEDNIKIYEAVMLNWKKTEYDKNKKIVTLKFSNLKEKTEFIASWEGIHMISLLEKFNLIIEK